MGGAPVLFLLVAMGITYGWQPDGNGGVEYVIQIPPEQLDELKRSGELTSVINPKVQSHVSRVIIKVGNETLQELTPPELNQTAHSSPTLGVRTASHDGSPVPIPEMREAVMKPADGFSLPSTLDEATSRAAGGLRAGANNVAAELDRKAREAAAANTEQARNASSDLLNRAGNALRNAAETAIGYGANNPALDPRFQNAANATEPPLFTGADPTGELARARQSVPSTDTTAQRDRSWYTDGRSRIPSTDPIGYQPNDPRSLVGPPDLRSTVQNSTQLPTPTYPSTASASQSSRSADQQPSFGGLGTTSTFGNLPADLRTSPPDARTGAIAYDPRASADPSYGASFTGHASDTSRTTASAMDVDPRLTNAQIATLPQGAWSFDAYGRPIDRDGRLLDQWGRPIATTTTPDTRLTSPTGYELNRSGLTSAPATQTLPNATYPTPGYPGQYDPGLAANPNYPDPRTALATTTGSYYPPVTAPPSATLQPPQAATTRNEQSVQQASSFDRLTQDTIDRAGNAGFTSTGAAGRAESKGPLFNFLLLVSGVGNLYLFFWLKNLRYRFRDLVAAKRVVTTNSSIV